MWCCCCLTDCQVQRVFQLVAYKTKRESATGKCMSAQELAGEYTAKVAVSSGEAVTVFYCQTAISVYEKVFKDDVCRQLVLQAGPASASIPAF